MENRKATVLHGIIEADWWENGKRFIAIHRNPEYEGSWGPFIIPISEMIPTTGKLGSKLTISIEVSAE